MKILKNLYALSKGTEGVYTIHAYLENTVTHISRTEETLIEFIRLSTCDTLNRPEVHAASRLTFTK
jgi:hypothetical protein